MDPKELPLLEEPMTISAEKVATFKDKGHVYLPGLLNKAELGAYRQVINQAAATFNQEKRSLNERDTYGKAFLQIMNLWQRDKAVAHFTLSKRFGKVAADMLGVPHVRLYHDQALYKEAGGGHTPWHQDQYYWPLDTTKTITMWMPLVNITTDMGMLTFASYSHKEGIIGNVPISDQSETFWEGHVREKEYPICREDQMQAGDTTWHYGSTLHHAPPNHSDITRAVMTLIFYDSRAKIIQPVNEHQENDRQTWLQGLPVGAAAASALNPIVY